jgi:hypothetical protein
VKELKNKLNSFILKDERNTKKLSNIIQKVEELNANVSTIKGSIDSKSDIIDINMLTKRLDCLAPNSSV